LDLVLDKFLGGVKMSRENRNPHYHSMQVPNYNLGNEDSISQEKLDWMNDVGIRELDRAFKYYLPFTGMFYSEEYLKNTPLEEIKAGHERTVVRESI
jgi:hypothetical protein